MKADDGPLAYSNMTSRLDIAVSIKQPDQGFFDTATSVL